MVRLSRSEGGSERFVQWKEAVPEQRDTANVAGPDSANNVRKKRPRKTQKSTIASLQASIDVGEVQEIGHRPNSIVRVRDTGAATLSHAPTVPPHTSPPPPQFKPPRQIHNTRGRSKKPKSVPPDGAVGQTDSENQHNDSEEHEDEDTSTPPQTGENQG
jgi:hypothetical protein